MSLLIIGTQYFNYKPGGSPLGFVGFGVSRKGSLVVLPGLLGSGLGSGDGLGEGAGAGLGGGEGVLGFSLNSISQFISTIYKYGKYLKQQILI